MSAVTLYKKHSKAELVEMDARVSADPENRNPNGGIYIHIPAARKLLEQIARAISFHMEDDRAKAGNPVSVCGYSGRNSKR